MLLERLAPAQNRGNSGFRQGIVAALFLITFVSMPAVLGGFWLNILTLGLFFAAFSTSWDLVFGLSGQVHFGPSLLVGAGGYTSGLLNIYTSLPLVLCIASGTLAAFATGLILAVASLRLKGPFLGLVTLAATLLMLNVVILLGDITGGERGKVVPDFLFFSATLNYFVGLALAIITIGCSVFVIRSKIGLVLAAIGQSVHEVEIVGISSTKYKVGVFALSAFISGLGGALLVHYLGSMSPSLLLALPVAVTILMGAMLGGSGTYIGPAIGAIFLVLLNEYARPLGEYRVLIVTLFVWLVIVVEVNGMTSLARKAAALTGLIKGHSR